jgi:threonyl-tRNA synthetase
MEQTLSLSTLRHTAAHVLAQAVTQLYPGAKLAIGPSIDSGFYYDFDVQPPFTPEDLPKIEKQMKHIIKQNLPLEQFTLNHSEALEYVDKQSAPFKRELIVDLAATGEGSFGFYKQGDFVDLCAGPHAPRTGAVKAFKLTGTAGAYWRGDEKRPMLSRIYGTAFFSREELDAHLAQIEEAKKRDHRKIGRDMKLFAFSDEGPGFPFYLPNGVVLKNRLLDWWRKIHRKYGYSEIQTPIMLSGELWHKSGHYDNYRDNMYNSVIDEREYFVKPMNCPGGMLVYGQEMRSYRDFPLRMAELGIIHRAEKSGTLHGIMRARMFTQDDAHIYMTPDQLKDEIITTIKLFEEVYAAFDLADFSFELSTRPENAIGTAEQWEAATNALREALDTLGRPYTINEGDGAFYGPKIDFHIRDCMGRSWQCGTIQCDMQLPERFDLTYVGPDGAKHRPVMIHRTCFGSVDRFLGVLTEHTAGWFPFWLTPIQFTIIPISERHHSYALSVLAQLEAAGLRATCDTRSEKMGFKIREASLSKIPILLIIGDAEMEADSVAVRQRGEDLGIQKISQAIPQWQAHSEI